MIYTDLTRKAIKFCIKAHEGQLDKSGIPYMLHPIHVAEQMEDELTTCVALLHDVVEDTDYTIEDVKNEENSYFYNSNNNYFNNSFK